MIALALLAAAVSAPASASAEQRFVTCATLARTQPEKAITEAILWRDAGGGLLARQCLGLAYVNAERWEPAALTYEQAARDAELQRDGRAATLWVQSGNASLAGNDPAKARIALDRAIALDILSPPMRGEALMDRARAAVAASDPAAARTDLDRALKLVPSDPMGWLLSATLARRQSELDRALIDISRAVQLAPLEPAIAYEQGNIAFARNEIDDARSAWQRVVKLASGTPLAVSAQTALTTLVDEAPTGH